MLRGVAAVSLLLLQRAWGYTVTLPDILYNGTVTAESTSIEGNLDGPKLTPRANSTSFDWWYFDAVSASTNASVTVVFYEAGPNGFINDYLGGPLSVSISGSFANGTLFSLSASATGGAIIHVDDDGIDAEWKGSGFSILGTGLTTSHATYVVTVDSPTIGVEGSFTLKSHAPAHYPCGLNVPGVSEIMVPHVFWSNAVPDASAFVNLTIGGSPLAFHDGVGYHDKNWGDAPFVTTTSSWYWGHARLGPYSLVWFDALDLAGTEYFSGYVAKRGKVLQASCATGAAVARPWGANDAYPPVFSTGVMQGLEVRFDLGEGETLVANVTTGLPVVDVGAYVRTLGTVTGAVEGPGGCKIVYEGRTLFEEFKFTGVPGLKL
ncbi:Hydroxyneurosporene dehydrogenase [Pleurostoma richardsiae]|uniref:Hydroxyneurosporene dehydrogenase n=1 Tax=Pleurostoma richardsiae TaxID=41990 RepID=A0AA38S444_9PEZI|nr:Hydroxyneurosporene dehydrogenase [Pleurostoma richardsiae]